MATFSLCMIVKNEEAVLPRCLGGAGGLFDEIVVVDTGSCDATLEIAKKYTDKVYEYAWADDFSAARNFSFSKAEKEYIMWLDADDILEKEDYDALLKLKNTLDKNIDTVFLRYNVAFDARGKPVLSYYRERIVKNCGLAVWTEPVHEAITPFGNMLYSEIAVTHKKIRQNKPGRNLSIMENYLRGGNAMSPRLQYYYARELMYNGWLADAAAVYGRFLEEDKGFTENNIGACRELSFCLKKLGEPRKSIEALFSGFRYGTPRAESLCDAGLYFFERNDLDTAAYWYSAALSAEEPPGCMGFIERDYYGYIPALQLCVIHDRKKDRAAAELYNGIAGSFRPEGAEYLYNKKYFDETS